MHYAGFVKWVCWLYCRGWLSLSGLDLYERRLLKVRNLLRVLAPWSTLDIINGSVWFSESSEFSVFGLGPPSRLALIIGAWIVLKEISESCEFAGVGSSVKVGFDYRGLVCITKGLQKF